MQDVQTATVLKYHPDSQASTFYKDDGEELDACHAGGQKFFPIDSYPPTINSKVSRTHTQVHSLSTLQGQSLCQRPLYRLWLP